MDPLEKVDTNFIFVYGPSSSGKTYSIQNELLTILNKVYKSGKKW